MRLLKTFVRPKRVGIARLCVWVALLLVVARPGWGIDSARAAVTLVQQAARSYEAGDFERAVDLYQKAWRLDPSPAYLWALARSEQLAGLNEAANGHYQQFIANPGAETARVGKAQAYLQEVQQELNKTRLREADAATRAGSLEQAADLYLQAYEIAPTRHELLFKAAVAEQRAEAYEAALRHFDVYLARAPASAEERGQASARAAWLRQELGVKPPPVPEKLTPTPTLADPVAPPLVGQKVLPVSAGPGNAVDLHDSLRVERHGSFARAKWPGWTAVAVGAVALASGLTLLVGAQADAAQLASDQTHAPGQLITSLSRETALNRASAINLRAGLGWTSTGVGLAASGFGVWWLLRHPERTVVIVPTATGAQLAVRF